MKTERKIFSFAAHKVWLEPPDAIFMDLDGDVTEANIKDFLVLVDQLGGGVGPVILIQDLRKAGTFSSGARKAIANDPRSGQIRSVICVGASFQMRVIMTMIEKAGKLLNRKLWAMCFASDEADGRRLLALERARLAKKGRHWEHEYYLSSPGKLCGVECNPFHWLS